MIFGHALEGNLHFVFTQDFNNQEEIDRYAGLMSEVSELVVHKVRRVAQSGTWNRTEYGAIC